MIAEMKTQTIKVIKEILISDETIMPDARNRILRIVSGEPTAEPIKNSNIITPKIYSREQAAQLLGDKTERYVDKLCNRGLLQKFIPPGNVRSIGVTANSLNQFLGINT